MEELITNYRWNRNVIYRKFNRADVDNILKIPINISGKADKHFWTLSRNGEFTVKSCYKALMKKEWEKEQLGKGKARSSFDDSNVQI